MQRSSSKITIAFFVFMAFVMAFGAIAPMLRQDVAGSQSAIQPTAVPTATVPAPIVDFSGISFDQVYLHPSGIFTVGQPTGWLPLSPVDDVNRAGVTLFNQNSLSIIEASVEQPTTPVTTIDELDARYTQTYLNASWARYGAWSETARKHENDRVVIDFNLTLNSQQYIARQVSWSDGEWVYNVRVVAPYNATQLVLFMIDKLSATLTPFKQFYGTPFGWLAYYDTVTHAIVRYPGSWTVADTAPGRPTSISGPDGSTLRVETQPNVTIADEQAATAWVESAQSGATILSTEAVTHGDAVGFSVAYSFKTVDGEARSGLAMLLNGPDSTLYAANLRFSGSEIDLNAQRNLMNQVVAATPDATAEATANANVPVVALNGDLAQLLDTFWILPALDIAPSTESVTPTPLPTTPAIIVPTTPPTSEATAAAEATSAPVSEATSDAAEATSAPVSEATPEATAAS